MTQSLPRPGTNEDWYNVLDKLPDDTGKFDCEVLDGGNMIYPALFVPRIDGEGPFWKVFIRKGDTRTVSAFKVPHWKPRKPRRTRK